jgi:hypothetical protein
VTDGQYLGPLDSQCVGKRGYTNKAAAKRFLRRSIKLHADFTRDDLNIYRCPHCRYFHIGHKPGRAA